MIEHTNTQVRYLPIISQIIRTIGNRSSTLSMLKNVLNKWSIEQERKSTDYKNHNGILTNNEKPTTAFPFYIELMMNLGLITKINEVVRNSKFGILFLTLEKFDTNKDVFSDVEKLFYLFFVLSKDADNIILILQEIQDNGGEANNKYLREQYETYLKRRLKMKAINANPFSQVTISDKLRRVEYIWQNAEEYSKHIIPPRIEWMLDFGLLKYNNNRIKTFEFTELGKSFYNSLESMDNSNIKDINDFWLSDKFISVFQSLCKNKTQIVDFDNLDEASSNQFLSKILPVAFKELDNDGLKRISGLPFYVFTMIVGLVKYNLAISFSALKSKLEKSFSTHEYTFAFRQATRINESYLTVSVNEI